MFFTDRSPFKPTTPTVKITHGPPKASQSLPTGGTWERIPEGTAGANEVFQDATDARLDAIEGQIVDLYNKLGLTNSKFSVGETSYEVSTTNEGTQVDYLLYIEQLIIPTEIKN